ncbi:MAG: hypothetical protein NC923_00245 [Candidatus Omnitrophica bacterium]|nr:hypothetical protein [Candidatus Omnitrophota bacterium]
MTKDEAIVDFFKGLRIALSNASVYQKRHPFFVKSSANFKKNVDALLTFLNPIKMGVTQTSLFIDSRFWDNKEFYREIASALHIRKIKSIEFRSGVTVEELADFLSAISMPKKEIIEKGGVQNILNPTEYPHLCLEELDYSSLLTDEGDEVANVWVAFFKSTATMRDPAKIKEFTDNFADIIKKIKVSDLLSDDELRESVYNFISYLKEKEKEKYLDCNKELLRWVIHDANLTEAEKLDKIRLFFNDLANDDFVEVLEEEILHNDNFDYLSLAVFSRLVEDNRNKDISVSLVDKMRNCETLKTDPRLRKKLREIFSSGEATIVPELYRQALISLTQDTSAKDVFSFDEQALETSYFYLLLNLLMLESNKERLSHILVHIVIQFEKAMEGKNLVFLKMLWQGLETKLANEPSLEPMFADLRRRMADFIEKIIVDAGIEEGDEIGFFSDNLKVSFLDSQGYLENIFKNGKVNPYILQLFFRFFPDQLAAFLNLVESRRADVDFLGKLMMSLGRIDEFFAKEILKRIFSVSNNMAKLEVLRTYRRMNICDSDVVLPIFKRREMLFKREAISVCRSKPEYLNQALFILFAMPSPFGINNGRLMQHIALAEELRLRESSNWLVNLSKRRFIWNKQLRMRAQAALKQLT